LTLQLLEDLFRIAQVRPAGAGLGCFQIVVEVTMYLVFFLSHILLC